MKASSLFLVFSLALTGNLFAGQSEISSKLARMADNLAAAYAKAPGAAQKPKAAVFTFNSSSELAKQRVGFAVSEMLSHHLANKGEFTLLERTELNQVLAELKLSMSGVTSQDDALKAGKLASAEVLILGSVEKFDSAYHINARIIRTETGEVLATDYQEVPVSAFEREAKDYIVLVPETQSIGIYFLYNLRGMKVTIPRSASTTDGTWTTTYNAFPGNKELPSAGIGIRYAPAARVLIDVAAAYKQRQSYVWKDDITNTDGTNTYAWQSKRNQKLTFFRALAGLTSDTRKSFSGFAGAGATYIKLSSGGDTAYTTPTIFLRGEYRPQQRIGFSLSGGYDLKTKTAKTFDLGLGDRKVGRLKQLYGETSLSIYF